MLFLCICLKVTVFLRVTIMLSRFIREVKGLLGIFEERIFKCASYYSRRCAGIDKVLIFPHPFIGAPDLCRMKDNVWITARV